MELVIVIGLGGIGSLLVEPLARYLNSKETCEKLLLVDGDTYSRSNLERQRISENDLNYNKAEIQARKLQSLFPKLSILAKPEYLSPKNASDVMVEDSAVFSCVDNHATRKLISDTAKRLKDIILISGGNEYTDGNIQVYWKANGRNKTQPIDKYHDEIKYPDDENPADLSCEEIAELDGGEQIIFTNLTVATLMLNAFYSVTMKGINYQEVYFDIMTNKANPVKR